MESVATESKVDLICWLDETNIQSSVDFSTVRDTSRDSQSI